MPDELTMPGNRISITEEHDVRSWCDSLGVTEEQLRIAVATVGDEADEVRGHLGRPAH